MTHKEKSVKEGQNFFSFFQTILNVQRPFKLLKEWKLENFITIPTLWGGVGCQIFLYSDSFYFNAFSNSKLCYNLLHFLFKATELEHIE